MLDAGGQPYDFIDTDADRTARRHLQTLRRGVRRIPTVAFPDGRFLVEPTDLELLEALTTPPPRA